MKGTLHLSYYGRLVAFSHTIFAFPFALIAIVVSARHTSVSFFQMAFIVVALVSARTAAMSFNRVIDRTIDKKNPRTTLRELPQGTVSLRSAILLTTASSAIFIFSAGLLGTACLIASPIVLSVLLGYSYTKRFTSYSHMVLGLALALAPGGAWFALRPHFSWEPIPLMVAVLFWVAGFDILYSCQDVEFDRQNGLYSLPAKLGVKNALTGAKLFHVGSILWLTLFGYVTSLGFAYWMGLIAFALFVAYQHMRVTPQDLSQVTKIFFTQNGIAAVLLFLGTLIDAL